MPDGIQKSKIMMTCYRAAAAEVTCLTALSKSRSDVILVFCNGAKGNVTFKQI
jgi:hypothetical protein